MKVSNVDQQHLRNEEIYRLRIVEGYTWRDIGEQVSMTHGGARKAFFKFIGEGITEDERNHYRAEETAKIDQIETVYVQSAIIALENKKLSAVFAAMDGRLKCIKQRTAINGLGQTTKVDITVTREDLMDKWDAFLEGAAAASDSADA